jgi:16S rRNA processing protein RimM
MGVVTKSHGLRGEFKVRPETDDPERFSGLSRVLVGASEAEAIEYSLRSVRFQQGKSGVTVLIQLEGVADRDGADAFAGRSIFAHQEDLPALDAEEVYLSDLIGLTAVDPLGEELGQITDVLELPAQPVLVLATASGGEVLVPFVESFVGKVDSEAGRIEIKPIEGLLDPDEQEEVI